MEDKIEFGHLTNGNNFEFSVDQCSTLADTVGGDGDDVDDDDGFVG